MKRELERYQLGPWRTLIVALQLSAAVGLLVGLSEPWLGRAAAAGLALMMLTGVGVRIKPEVFGIEAFGTAPGTDGGCLDS